MANSSKKSETDSKTPVSKVSTYGRTRKAADTKIVVNDQLTKEDEFAGLYVKKGNQGGMLIEPPYNLRTLANLVTRNNILSQCVSTMEVNVDGTGYTIDAIDSESEGNEAEKEFLENFFNEPWPGISFTSIRRQLRWDLEATGNAYLEVIRNLAKQIVFLRYVDATLIRLVKLDDPVIINKEITRGNEKFNATMHVRERRYATKVGAKLQYYREFGSSRMINRNTGVWIDGKSSNSEDKTPTADDFGSELIHFIVDKDVRTSYGVPRWINQLPSVLGSRKAEEFNLEFFDNGGIPPAAIFIQGGAIGNDVKQQLEGYFGGGAKGKHRVALVEVMSASGSLDSAGSVQVKTERFGDSRASDAMFQNYDKNTEDHVRIGFRIPPIFVGKSSDYNFATAMTAYMVTEAQVFQPEREEFDEIINSKIVKSFGFEDWRFSSMPLTLKNIDIQLKALEMVKDKIKPEDLVENINELAGLALNYDASTDELNREIREAELDTMRNSVNPGDPAGGNRNGVKTPGNTEATVKRASELTRMHWLVNDWLIAIGAEDGDLAGQTRAEIATKVESLSEDDRKVFDAILSLRMFGTDESGLMELAGCAACAAGHEHDH